MKQDRFLLGILIGIATLVAAAILVFLLRPDTLEYGAEDTPEGVVRNYVIAIHRADYERAYTYLADAEYKPTIDTFSEPFMLNFVDPASSGVEVLDAKISTQSASVELSILYNNNDPFSGGYRNTDFASLVLQDGQWKLKLMPYPFWYYDWYQEPYEPDKP